MFPGPDIVLCVLPRAVRPGNMDVGVISELWCRWLVLWVTLWVSAAVALMSDDGSVSVICAVGEVWERSCVGAGAAVAAGAAIVFAVGRSVLSLVVVVVL